MTTPRTPTKAELVLPAGHTGAPDTFYLPESFYIRHGLMDMIPNYVRPHVYLVKDERDISDLPSMIGGRAVRPQKEVVLYGADGRTLTVIPGAGVTESAELQDLVTETWEKQKGKLARGEPVIDFAAYREKKGYPRKEDFDPLFRQALRDRMAKHRANPVSDPAPVRVDRPRRNVYGTSEPAKREGS